MNDVAEPATVAKFASRTHIRTVLRHVPGILLLVASLRAETPQSVATDTSFIKASNEASAPAYHALLRAKTTPGNLRTLEETFIPSLELTDVTLARVAAVFSVCDENPSKFDSSILLADADPDWSARVVNLTRTQASLAEIYDEICRQTGSVWWVDTEVHFAPKTTPDKNAAGPVESV